MARGLESAQTPFALNRPRQPASLGFLAQVPKNPHQFVRTRFVDQPLRRQRLPRVHPHVERTALLKTEAPFHPIELRRTHTQIQQHPIAGLRLKPVRQFRKIAALQLEPAIERRQPRRGCFKRGAIAIAPKQPSTWRAPLQNRRGVSTATDGAVHVAAARLRFERRRHLRHHHGLVDELGHCAWRSP